MSAPVMGELMQLEAAYRRTEQARAEAAEDERIAFVVWQEAYGAYEIACDEASAAWKAWVQALVA